jgi:hypothetical protein
MLFLAILFQQRAEELQLVRYVVSGLVINISTSQQKPESALLIKEDRIERIPSLCTLVAEHCVSGRLCHPGCKNIDSSIQIP